MLSNIGLHLAACTGHISIFNTGGKFRLVSTFTELHTPILATRSYTFLHYSVYTVTHRRMIANTGTASSVSRSSSSIHRDLLAGKAWERG